MLPNSGGEGAKSTKQITFIGKLFGSRKERTGPADAESPRSNNRAGSGSLQPHAGPNGEAGAANAKANWMLSPRQPGAALTTGTNRVASPTGTAATGSKPEGTPTTKRLLFGGTPSTKQLAVSNRDDDSDDSADGAIAALLNRKTVLKRSFTTTAEIASVSSHHKLSPLPTATAIANAGERPSSTTRSKPAPSVKADDVMNLPAEAIESKSDEELKKMIQALQKETKSLKSKIEEASGSGSGGKHRTSVVIADFNAPKHQQRPSMIQSNLEQIKAGLAQPPTSRPSVMKVPAAGGSHGSDPSRMELDEEDSGFLEDDDAPKKPVFKPGAKLNEILDAKEQHEADAAKKKKEREEREAKEAAERAAAAAAASRAQPQSSSSAKQQQPRKYKLLAVYPLLAPNMRREEWSLHEFTIEKKLHAGYASEVYRARDIQSGEMLAVKVYNLNALGELNKVQLIREIRLHGSFVHRNIIELYSAFQENYRVILAQRYAEGGDLLRALHNAGGRLTEKSAVQMVIHPLLNCLVYLHAKGITHRDIKPENILFDGEGVLKLADFGLAINLTEEHAVTRAGTLHYMAPEVVKNPLKDHPDDFKNETRYHYNAVVDSWAVGCLAFELIVGFPPFMAETQQQVVKNINSMEVRYPKKMSEECVDFIKAALQRNPQDRATSSELIKHPWIQLHMRRNSSRQLVFEPQSYANKPGAVPDFAPGPAIAKAQMAKQAASNKSKEGSKMAPF